MAKKHVPVIEAPEKAKAKEPFTVKVKVGGIDGIEHPNTLGHGKLDAALRWRKCHN